MDFRLNIQSVPGNGDCLFYSVSHIILDRYKGAKLSSKVPSLENLTLYLRRKVALRVLDVDDAESNGIIQTWHKLWTDAVREKDAELMNEMRHMQNVLQPMSLCDRKILFRNMCNPAVYWGDEFALKTLERLLGCMFVVVNDRFEIVQREYSSSSSSSSHTSAASAASHDLRWISMLLLRGMHYEPLHDNEGSYCWALGQLPPAIQGFVEELLGRG
jgi:hypothetical protein